jgi:cytochrome c oxidase assembly factor CtaG
MRRQAAFVAFTGAGAFKIAPASAHLQDVEQAPPFALMWSDDPLLVLPLGAVGLIWLVGLLRLAWRARHGPAVISWTNLAFLAGWVALALALRSPSHAAGTRSFLAHMSEHELLMLVAAPLLAASRPAGILLWGLPQGCRRAVAGLGRASAVRTLWRAATDPVFATLVHGALLWVWHLPVLFDAAVRDEALHLLQHASFFGSAMLFWWALFRNGVGRRGYGLAICAIFVTAVHSSLLGALLFVAPRVLYDAYATTMFGLSPLEDQQLAGLIIWVPAGIVHTSVGSCLFALWLRAVEGNARKTAHVSTAR